MSGQISTRFPLATNMTLNLAVLTGVYGLLVFLMIFARMSTWYAAIDTIKLFYVIALSFV